jgi:hypothetical protein
VLSTERPTPPTPPIAAEGVADQIRTLREEKR